MNGYNQKKISIFALIFYFLLIILAVFVFSHVAELKNIVELFKKIKPFWFILALMAQVLTYIFTANVYYKLLSLYNHKSLISRPDLFRVSIITLFLSQVIPPAGLSGGSYLIHYFQKKKLPSHESFAVAILQNSIYYFCSLLLLLFSLFYMLIVLKEKLHGILLGVAILGIFLFVSLNIIILIFGSKRALIYISGKIAKHKWLKFFFKKIQFSFPGQGALEGEWESPFEIIKNKIHYLWRPFFWQLMEFLADAATIFLLFCGFNFRPNFLTIMAGMILTKVVALIAISPGALVIFEGAMVLFYSSFGIPLNLAVVVTLLFRALSFWLPMPFGLFLFKRLSDIESQSPAQTL